MNRDEATAFAVKLIDAIKQNKSVYVDDGWLEEFGDCVIDGSFNLVDAIMKASQ